MNIWIDLANAPHVPFLFPIMEQLREKGHGIDVTMRRFNQTVELAASFGIQGTEIGGHGGRKAIGKLRNLFDRTRDMIRYARDRDIDLAVSHNSYTHNLAGRAIGATVVTLMDYEGQPANHVAFRAAHKVIVPDSFPEKALRRFGAHGKKVYRYKGFKEQLYLSRFTPDPSFVSELRRVCGLHEGWKPDEHVLVVLRTPATMAAYHPKHNALFDALLERICGIPFVTAVMLPRNHEQRIEYGEKFPALVFPEAPLPGDQLVYHADLVISAGGTMNREAAILGTPVYSIFAGLLPSVDRQLVELDRMKILSSLCDIEKLAVEKRPHVPPLVNPHLCEELVEQILG